MKTIVLLSGGIDSTVALVKSKADVALSFDYNQTHRRELDSAAKIAKHYEVIHRVLPLTFGCSALTGTDPIPEHHAEEPDATEVPGRNLVMIATAVAWAQDNEYDCVVIGANADDRNGYPDCRPEFLTALDDATRVGYGITVWAPLLKMTKRQIIESARRMNVPIDLTWSCYRGGAEPCNRCGACESRNEAMS